MPPRFDLDPQAIEKAFFERSKELHADKFASAPAAERVAALSKSRALNDAYQAIKKPVPRAEYLLARAGVPIGDNERLDPAFLMEILELREELAEARAAGKLPPSGDSREDDDRKTRAKREVERLQGGMKRRRDEAVAALPALFAQSDLPGIKERLIVLRYLNRYLEECDAALDED